jgi:hypothetical protein
MFIILVSYRSRIDQPFRRTQIIEMIDNIKKYFHENDVEYKIVIIEQNNDYKFNRGWLLNIAFLESEKMFLEPKKYFHMNVDYTFDLSRKFPNELFELNNGFIELYLLPFKYILASACVFDPESYKKINGFPNDLEGWGGDDWAIYKRVVENNIIIFKPDGLFNSNFIKEKDVVIEKDFVINDRNIELSRRDDCKTNGLNSIKYSIDGYGEFYDGKYVFHYLANYV